MKKHPETKQVNPRVEDQQIVATAGTVAKKRRPTLKSNTGSKSGRIREYQEFCKRLVFLNGAGMSKQMLDLDGNDRSLGRLGSLARRTNQGDEATWWDLQVALLDHYLLLLKPDRRGTDELEVVSRPIPLEYLRLDSFDGSPDIRKERTHGIPSLLSLNSHPVFPFEIHHVSWKKYTLYCRSEEERQEWKKALEEAIIMRKAVNSQNQLFGMNIISLGYFRHPPPHMVINSRTQFTGKIITVALLRGTDGEEFLAVGTTYGVHVAPKDSREFQRVLRLNNVKQIRALDGYDRVLILSEMGLRSYSLSHLIRAASGDVTAQQLDASIEPLSRRNQDVVCMHVGTVRMNDDEKMLVTFATKGIMEVHVHQYEVLPAGNYRLRSGLSSFASFGIAATIPKDSFGITSIANHIGFCTSKGIIVAEPERLYLSTFPQQIIPRVPTPEPPTRVPTITTKCLASKPLGVVQTSLGEMLVVYDNIGCYINAEGEPIYTRKDRQSAYLQWESKATSYASRGSYLLLFSPNYVEIRTINEGILIQVMEGEDIRLVHSGEGGIFVAKKGGERNDGELLAELVEANRGTRLIEHLPPIME